MQVSRCVALAGPAHLAGKPNGVLAALIMAQMELDYMQRVAESNVRYQVYSDYRRRGGL